MASLTAARAFLPRPPRSTSACVAELGESGDDRVDVVRCAV